MSIANIGSYYSNLIDGPRQLQSVFVKPSPELTSALGTGASSYPQIVPMAGVFGAGSIITNVHLCGANPNNATFMVGIAGSNASLTGDLVALGGTYGILQPAVPGIAGLGVTLAQDSWLTVRSAGGASGAGTLAANNLNLYVSYLS
jgi:hypothetical protein